LQADVYSYGRSEELIKKAIEKYSIPRNRLVILSKCFFGVEDDPTTAADMVKISINAGEFTNRTGLSRKHIMDAVEASVKRLGTYIDVLQIHRLDPVTPPEEIMKALNDCVEKGWVRYLGASSMRAWQFQNLQVRHAVLDRSFKTQKVHDQYTHTAVAGCCRASRLAQVHLHAKLPQPHLP